MFNLKLWGKKKEKKKLWGLAILVFDESLKSRRLFKCYLFR